MGGSVSLLVLYLAISSAFVAGWVVRSLWQQPDRNDLCGVRGCVTCLPYERRQPEAIPDGVLILRAPKQRVVRRNLN